MDKNIRVILDVTVYDDKWNRGTRQIVMELPSAVAANVNYQPVVIDMLHCAAADMREEAKKKEEADAS